MSDDTPTPVLKPEVVAASFVAKESAAKPKIARAKAHVAKHRGKYTAGAAGVLGTLVVVLQIFGALCPLMPANWGLQCNKVAAAADALKTVNGEVKLDEVKLEDGPTVVPVDAP